MKYFFISLSLLISLSSYTYAQENPHIYSTGTVLELDRCASAWLIKRFVDKDAVFQFFPDGDFIKNGIPFDTPDSGLCRTHNMSTFAVIVEKYKISDKSVDKIGKYIHDIEINFWGKKRFQESLNVSREVNKIIRNSKNNDECLTRCFLYFDQLTKEIGE